MLLPTPSRLRALPLILLTSQLVASDLRAQTPTYSWFNGIGGTGFEQCRAVTMDGSGNVYSTGYFQNTVDFNPGPGVLNGVSNGAGDVFVLRSDPTGATTWLRTIGGSFTEVGDVIEVDDDGNVYVAGTLQSATDLDQGPGQTIHTPQGVSDPYLVKFDANGTFQWAYTFVGSGAETLWGVAFDANGDVWCGGNFQGTVDFDPGPGQSTFSSGFNQHGYLVRLSAAGAFEWAGVITSTLGFSIRDVVADPSGPYVYIGGGVIGFADMDLGPGSSFMDSNTPVSAEAYVAKYDLNGGLQWTYNFGGASGETVDALAAGQDGSLFVSGEFTGLVDVDPMGTVFNIASAGISEGYVFCLNNDLTLRWATAFGGPFADRVVDIGLDVLGRVYATGYYAGTATIGTFLLPSAPSPNYDTFIARLDVNGVPDYAASIEADDPYCIAVSASGNVVMGGKYQAIIDMEPGPGITLSSPQGADDIYLVYLDQCLTPIAPGNVSGATSACPGATLTYSVPAVPGASSYTWSLPNGWTGSSTSNTITVQTGPSSGTVSVVANNTCGGSSASSLTVGQGSPTGSTFSVNACDSYTWTNGITYTSSTSTATQTFVTAQGCDSVVTLDLTLDITPPTPQVVLNGATLTCNTAGASYQWLDCNLGNQPIAGANDATFTPVNNGLYAVEVSNGNCSSTSNCVAVISTGTNERGGSSGLVAFPNPFDDVLIIDPGLVNGPIQIRMLNAAGQLVHAERRTQGGLIELHPELAPGSYTLHVEGVDGSARRVHLVLQ